MQRRSLHLALAAAALAAPAAAPRRAFAQTAAAAAEPGWTPLFNGRDMAGWEQAGDANWRVEDGALVADRGNGFLVTRDSYGDFELRVEVWVDTSTNSGIFVRAGDPARITAATSYEINLWDERPEPRFGTGAVVDVAPVDPMPRAGGRWNDLGITARGDALSVVLNGQRTVDNARDSRHARGRIALQHGMGVRDDRGVVRFRRVEIRAL